MCLPITLCCFFSSKYKLAFFQMLLSHWSIKIWPISPPYLRGLLNTFPKWYDTWNSDENWAFYGQKTEELCFCQKFWKNFRGLFGALKLEIFLKKRYFGVTLDRHYLILRSKSKSKKLTAHLLFFGPMLYTAAFVMQILVHSLQHAYLTQMLRSISSPYCSHMSSKSKTPWIQILRLIWTEKIGI